MGAIDNFVAAFSRDFDKYLSIEKEVRALCEEALLAQKIVFLWQSRVKAAESLKTKLEDRNDKYNDESENVADVVDLVAGRIILADRHNCDRVEEIIKGKFNFRAKIAHPKLGQTRVNPQSRFRGYGAFHFHVTQKSLSDEQSCNTVIEIQVMTAYMWAYSIVAHDIEYKKLHGEPSKDLVSSLEVLKGVANLGEIGLEMFDRHFVPVARLSPQQSDIDPNLPSTIRTVVAEIGLDEIDKQCLRDLRLTDPRHDKERIETSKDRVLEGSCSWIFEDSAFLDWWTRDDCRFLWIHGGPGKGKTMMMIALISENTSEKLNTAVSVLRGLIYHLVDQEKSLIRHVRKHYDNVGRQLFEDENALYALRMVFSDMVKDQRLENVYFMVDALDECDPEIHELLEWIIRENSEVPPKIKWLTTSRNDPAFIEQLGRSHQLHTSLDLNSTHVAHAVVNFIEYKVKELASLKLYTTELQDFVQKYLLDKAEETFLWVALVCKELKKVRKQHTTAFLEKIPAGLELFYERMLKQLFHQENRNDIESCRRILCTVVLAFRPLRLEEILVFAEISDVCNEVSDLEDLVGLCGSFITIQEGIAYLVHQSAKDYLSHRNRKSIFHSGKGHKQANTARVCLEVMSSTLKKDICDFRTPGICLSDVDESRIGAHIPCHAQYACLYWTDHIQEASSTERETLVLREGCSVLGFLQRHFLHWLEVLSLMGEIFQAEFAIASLRYMTVSQINTNLSSFVNDARRFIRESICEIERAPLQIYNSALLFSPKTSIISGLFSHDLPLWIERLPNVEETWPASLPADEDNSYAVTEMAFSPNGQLLASVSQDFTIRLWDLSMGALRDTFKGHSDKITAVLFSPNSQYLASTSLDDTIRLCDLSNRASDTLKGHSGWVSAVAFSPNSQFLASASLHEIVTLWDSSTGASLRTLEGHSVKITAMIFSPNSQLLACASSDTTIRLWDPIKEALRGTLEGHLLRITAVAFSTDGQIFASASRDGTIRLWDPFTKASRGTLKHRLGAVTTIIFSPNDSFLASTHIDGTVTLWELETRKVIQRTTHRYERNISFSKDGLQLELDGRLINILSSSLGVFPQEQVSIDEAYSREWVFYKGSKVIWLPLEHRLGGYTLRDNNLVLRNPSGRITFLRFSKTVAPF